MTARIPTGGIGIRKSTANGIMRIMGTDIESDGATINGAAGPSTIRVTSSQLRGAAVTGALNVICAGNSDENTVFFASTCP